jgi:tetratricopeptide (TPR) repeat protein
VLPESPRIAELRRRVHADPASIAFAQLAEEYRRAGHYDDAIKYCRSGLARHPGYLSARVTLGRALSEIGSLDEAAREFMLVLDSAPDNLAAIRGMAEIHQHRGDMPAALEYYKRALELARFDPELEDTVNRIRREVGAVAAASGGSGMSFEQAASEFLAAADGAPAASDISTPGHPPRPDLIDFDAILASLGVPDASPPPVMQMLVPEPAKPAAPPEAAVSVEEQDAAVNAVIDELETWMRVLQNEHAPRVQPTDAHSV